jgi:hypothetical protein
MVASEKHNAAFEELRVFCLTDGLRKITKYLVVVPEKSIAALLLSRL